jgi:hypothetical protein
MRNLSPLKALTSCVMYKRFYPPLSGGMRCPEALITALPRGMHAFWIPE